MRTFVRFVEVSVLRVAEQVIDVPELVSRVMKDDGPEQIVQMVKVVPPERPSERVVAVFLRRWRKRQTTWCKSFLRSAVKHWNVEQADDFLVQRFIPQDCVQEQMAQVDRVMPQERLLEQQVAKEIREVIMDVVTAREETLELLKFSKEGCAGSGLDFVLLMEEITQDLDPRSSKLTSSLGSRWSVAALVGE